MASASSSSSRMHTDPSTIKAVISEFWDNKTSSVVHEISVSSQESGQLYFGTTYVLSQSAYPEIDRIRTGNIHIPSKIVADARFVMQQKQWTVSPLQDTLLDYACASYEALKDGSSIAPKEGVTGEERAYLYKTVTGELELYVPSLKMVISKSEMWCKVEGVHTELMKPVYVLSVHTALVKQVDKTIRLAQLNLHNYIVVRGPQLW